MMDDARLNVLRQVRAGTLDIEEADRLLAAGEPQSLLPAFSSAPPVDETAPEIGCWGQAWLVAVIAGTAFLALSAWLMNWAYANVRAFWFACSWIPLILSVIVLLTGVWSRYARWAHIRVHDKAGTNIVISAPVPFRLVGWLLRIFGRYIPRYQEKNLDFLPDIFEALSNARDAITVEVDDKDGSQVRVYVL